MNQTKLEVIKINEDVIATSGVPAHCYSLNVVGVSTGGYDEFYYKVTNPIFKEGDIIDSDFSIKKISGQSGLFLYFDDDPKTSSELSIGIQNKLKYIYNGNNEWGLCQDHSEIDD